MDRRAGLPGGPLRTRTCARLSGEARRHTIASCALSLTPTELRVAADVTEGLSNPQIAARMFITRRTVTIHLTSIYRKIDVSTRAELAAAVTRHQRNTEGPARAINHHPRSPAPGNGPPGLTPSGP